MYRSTIGSESNGRSHRSLARALGLACAASASALLLTGCGGGIFEDCDKDGAGGASQVVAVVGSLLDAAQPPKIRCAP